MMVNVEQVVRENIDRTVHLSLATTVDNIPWVCEVHFAYDDELNLYFRSLTTRRHSQEIAVNSRVAGNIIETHPVEASEVLGLYFEGQAELVTDEIVVEKSVKLIATRLQLDQDEVMADIMDPNGHKLYKITVGKWYVFGKFDGKDKPSTKHMLEWK